MPLTGQSVTWKLDYFATAYRSSSVVRGRGWRCHHPSTMPASCIKETTADSAVV